ncbi:MAG: DUF4199 domain-containing protein [Sphingobacteriales bacterium]|nr:MAG: DUF4199 domain-containing protein [Sphingobacteriales bacterium]
MLSENIGVKYGMYLGLGFVLLFGVLYAVNPVYMYNTWLGLSIFPIIIVVMVLAARQTKKDLGGYATFTQLVSPAFAVMVFAQLFSSLFNYILYNFIDPTLTDTLRNFTIESTYNMLNMFGTPEEEIEKAITKVEEQDYSVTLSSTFMGFAMFAIFGFVVASIIALIMRKNPPSNLNDQEVEKEELDV